MSLGCGEPTWDLENRFLGCSLCCPSFVLLLIEVGLDQVPFKCPLQSKAPCGSGILGSLGMGFSVFLTLLSWPEHPQEAASRDGAVARLGWGHRGFSAHVGVTLAGCHQSLCRTGRGNKKKDSGVERNRGRDPSLIPSWTQYTEHGDIISIYSQQNQSRKKRSRMSLNTSTLPALPPS